MCGILINDFYLIEIVNQDLFLSHGYIYKIIVIANNCKTQVKFIT